jgi:hypothetical protein
MLMIARSMNHNKLKTKIITQIMYVYIVSKTSKNQNVQSGTLKWQNSSTVIKIWSRERERERELKLHELTGQIELIDRKIENLKWTLHLNRCITYQEEDRKCISSRDRDMNSPQVFENSSWWKELIKRNSVKRLSKSNRIKTCG